MFGRRRSVNAVKGKKGFQRGTQGATPPQARWIPRFGHPFWPSQKSEQATVSSGDRFDAFSEILTMQMAGSRDPLMRQMAAKDPGSTSLVLSRLARDDDPQVRLFVAQHPNTSQESLQRLAEDVDASVRECAASILAHRD